MSIVGRASRGILDRGIRRLEDLPESQRIATTCRNAGQVAAFCRRLGLLDEPGGAAPSSTPSPPAFRAPDTPEQLVSSSDELLELQRARDMENLLDDPDVGPYAWERGL